MNDTTKINYRVLILDADFIAALTILRSLSRQNIQCDLGSAVDKPISHYSRYANTHFKYPDPLIDSQAFITFIKTLLQDKQYDLIIPVTERSLIPLAESEEFNTCRDKLAISDNNSLSKVLDKAKTMQLARECAVSTPYSHAVSTLEEIHEVSNSIDYPVVLKPGQSIPNANHRRQLSVTYAHNQSELINLSKDLLPYCQLLIQQYAKGIGTGIELLADHGEIVYAFQHLRIHEQPLTGGGSCLRKSISLEPVLLKAAEKLIAALHWHGVAMVEFKWDPETGQYWLMEINGRFWGSLPLAVAAGADFPKMLFDLLALNKRPKSKEYKTNIYGRKLSADLNWLEQVIRKNEDARLVKYPEKKQIIKDFLLIFHPTRHFFDVQSFIDPLPGIIDFFSITKEFALRFYELLSTKLRLRYHASAFIQKRATQKLREANNVLFLCYGNINRSAVSHAIAEQSPNPQLKKFFSTGFHRQNNRSADPTMIKVAAEHNIDLSDWHSSTINEQLVNQADIIFAMETQHLDRLYKEFPKAKGKSFLLGTLTAKQYPDIEIEDPYAQDYSIYKKVFHRIQTAIKEAIRIN